MTKATRKANKRKNEKKRNKRRSGGGNPQATGTLQRGFADPNSEMEESSSSNLEARRKRNNFIMNSGVAQRTVWPDAVKASEMDSRQPWNGAEITEIELEKIEETLDQKFQVEIRRCGKEEVRNAPVRPKKMDKPLIDWINRKVLDAQRKAKGFKQVITALYVATKVIGDVCSEVARQERKNIEKMTADRRKTLSRLDKVCALIHNEMKRRREKKVPNKRQIKNIHFLKRFGGVGKSMKWGDLMRAATIAKRRAGDIRSKMAQTAEEEEEEIRRVRNKSFKHGHRSRVMMEAEGASARAIRSYWEQRIGKPKKWDEKNRYIVKWTKKMKKIRLEEEEEEEDDMVDWDNQWEEVLRKVKSWKTPGPDGIYGYFWKRVPAARAELKRFIRRKMETGGKVPRYLAEARVVLIPKSETGSPTDPETLRPITCMNVAMKIWTAMIAKMIRSKLDVVLPPEQVALAKGRWGVTHARAIDEMIMMDAKKDRKELYMTWIDYAKAYDSVPHKLVGWMMKVIGVKENIRKVYLSFLENHRVKYEVMTEYGIEWSKKLDVRSGLPQGDTLSPLLFGMVVAPVSEAIRTSRNGYLVMNKTVKKKDWSHVFYVDDLKLYAENERRLLMMIGKVRTVSRALGLELDSKKCVIKCIGKLSAGTEKDEEIPELNECELYKNLGIYQCGTNDTKANLEFAETRIIEGARQIFESGRKVGQKTYDYNCMVVPVAQYIVGNVFGGGDGSHEVSMKEWAKKVDKKVAQVMVDTNCKLAKCSRDRLYVAREKYGFGMVSIELAVKRAITYTYVYVMMQDELEDIARYFERSEMKGRRTILTDFKQLVHKELKGKLEIGIKKIDGRRCMEVNGYLYESIRMAADAICKVIDDEHDRKVESGWSKKSGSFRENPEISLEDSVIWWKRGWLNSKTARNICGIQEKKLETRGNMGNDGRKECRKCQSQVETLQHVASGCTIYRSTLIMERHKRVCLELYNCIAEFYGLKKVALNRRPDAFRKNERASIYYDFNFPTLNRIRANKPNLVVINKVNSKHIIIDVGIAWSSDISKMEKYIAAKYNFNGMLQSLDDEIAYPGPNLATDLHLLYKCETKVVPIVMGVCGEVSKKFRKHIMQVPGVSERNVERVMESMQRGVVLGTDRIIQVHLSGCVGQDDKKEWSDVDDMEWNQI